METKEIRLSKGFVAIVDTEDFEELNQYKWSAKVCKNTCYAHKGVSKKEGANKFYAMHRMILDIHDPKIFIDHKDGNGLNNCKHNLRVATFSQNNANKKSKTNTSSSFLGVSAFFSRGKERKIVSWSAKISNNGKYIHLGHFKTEELAALAYNTAALKIHGEFAKLNDIAAGLVTTAN